MVKLIIFIIILSILFNVYDSFIKPMHKKRLIEEENKMKHAIKAEKEFQIQKAYEQKLRTTKMTSLSMIKWLTI